ncbi:hypothetical protein DHODJN_19455 [Methylorubrum extorquens]
MKRATNAVEQDREDVKAARLSWSEGQLDLDQGRLVFLDETAPTTKMIRYYGRAPRGKRCRVAVPFRHVWTPPGCKQKLWKGAARDRGLACIRPLMQRITCCGLVCVA